MLARALWLTIYSSSARRGICYASSHLEELRNRPLISRNLTHNHVPSKVLELEHERFLRTYDAQTSQWAQHTLSLEPWRGGVTLSRKQPIFALHADCGPLCPFTHLVVQLFQVCHARGLGLHKRCTFLSAAKTRLIGCKDKCHLQ
jgi:hypothetical protein